MARLDPKTLKLSAVLGLGKTPVGMTVGNDAVWIVSTNGWLWRVWPAGPHAEGVARLGRRTRAIATAGSWVWVLREPGKLIRVEPATGEITLETDVGRGALGLFAADDALWVTCKRGRRLLRVNADSGHIEAEVSPHGRVLCLAYAGETIWVGCGSRLDGRIGWLYPLDARAAALGELNTLPARPRALAVGQGGVWVACAHRRRRRGTIVRFDPETGLTDVREETEWPVYDLSVSGNSILAAMGLAVSSTADGGSGIMDLGLAGDGGGGGGGDGGGGN